ncbi:sugar phosphate nucleotidyltransferase [Candidatus Aenigmatarchaeota archaeon]
MSKLNICILSAGEGKRLMEVTDGKIPKILVPLKNQTVLGRLIEDLVSYNHKPVVSIYMQHRHSDMIKRVEKYMETHFPEIEFHICKISTENPGEAFKIIASDNENKHGIFYVNSDIVLSFGVFGHIVNYIIEKDYGLDLLIGTSKEALNSSNVKVIVNKEHKITRLLKNENNPQLDDDEEIHGYAGVSYLSSISLKKIKQIPNNYTSPSLILSKLASLVKNSDIFEHNWSVNINTKKDYVRVLELIDKE